MSEKKDKLIEQLREKIRKEETDTLNYILPEFLAKIIVTYMSMREDLLLVQRQTTLLLEYQNTNSESLDPLIRDTIIPALWYSIVVTYGRCFTDATQSLKSKLEIKDCCLENELELSEIHKEIMYLRHNFVAHRGDTENEQAVVIMKVPKGELTEKITYRIKSLRATNPTKDVLEKYLELFAHIQKIVEGKLHKQTEKVNERIQPHQLKDLLVR